MATKNFASSKRDREPPIGKNAESGVTVRDPKTGRMLTVKGVGALKDSGFAIRKGVDLTKPIAEQVLKADTRSKGGMKVSAGKPRSRD